MSYFHSYNSSCILHYTTSKYLPSCKRGSSIYITLDILTGPDLECRVFSNENVISSVNMSNHNTCRHAFDSADSLKINCTNVFSVNHQLNAMVIDCSNPKSPSENVYSRFWYNEHTGIRVVGISKVSFGDVKNQHVFWAWRR